MKLKIEGRLVNKVPCMFQEMFIIKKTSNGKNNMIIFSLLPSGLYMH